MEDQKLLIQCHSESLLQHVTSLKSVKRFMSTMNPDPEAISQVLELEKPVAMICYIDDDLDKRLPDLQPLLEDVTVVFLSNGNPYPNLDHVLDISYADSVSGDGFSIDVNLQVGFPHNPVRKDGGRIDPRGFLQEVFDRYRRLFQRRQIRAES